MLLKKFLNGLPVLGLLAMLTACPVTDASDVASDGSITSKDPAVKDLQEKFKSLNDKLSNMMSKDEIMAQFKKSNGIVDLTDNKVAWGKVAEIMKDSKIAACSVFYPVDTTNLLPHSKGGSKGGSFKFFSSKDKDKMDVRVAAATAKDDFLVFEYDNYSVDGIYKLTGKFPFKANGATVPATATKPYIGGADAKIGYALVTAVTLKLEPVVAADYKLAGFGETKSVEVKFPAQFGLQFEKDGKTCPTFAKNDAAGKNDEITIGTGDKVFTTSLKDNDFKELFAEKRHASQALDPAVA